MAFQKEIFSKKEGWKLKWGWKQYQPNSDLINGGIDIINNFLR